MRYCEYNGFFDGKTALVTGGAGFIGSHLTQHLVALGCQVRVLDDFSTGLDSNIEHIDMECIQGSILDKGVLFGALQGCSLIFHQAAFVSVQESIKHPKRCNEINVQGTINVIEGASRVSSQRIVFASTAACYGSNPNLPSTELDPVSLESPYANSKYLGEQSIASMRDVDGVSLRYFNVFGERQNPDSSYAAVVCAFQKSIQQHQAPVVYGDGTQTRDFTAVENIVHANLLAASHNAPLCGSVLNVGTGRSMSILSLLQAMRGDQYGGEKGGVIFETARVGDIQDSRADISAITQKLGYMPILHTEEALKRLLNPTQQ